MKELIQTIKDIFNIKNIKVENENLKKKIDELGITEYEQTEKLVLANMQNIEKDELTIKSLEEKISTLNEDIQSKNNQLNTSINKLSKTKETYKSIEYSISKYLNEYLQLSDYKIPYEHEKELDELAPSVILKLNCMNVLDLQKAYRQNEKEIDKLLQLYSSRYTTKANKTIYDLMVIALRAELQNIIIDLKYEKLDNAIDKFKKTIEKYLVIVGEGNQNILSTLTKFIGQVEYLFINAIKIEYNYYVKKEQSRQEQLAIREQMRQETEERKALEIEKKKVEKEEEKFKNEIEKVSQVINNTVDENELAKLNTRILELQSKLAEVIIKKEEIVNLQNGKAGTVYVISNLGAFGEDIFKIGMTRRLEPQDRINELGDASVPFKFDVHSFIFSEDAVLLEFKMHQILNKSRLNKVNRRKEFFKVNIEELEKIVRNVDPTAEFNKTMIAEEFRESLSTDDVYEDNEIIEFTDDESI